MTSPTFTLPHTPEAERAKRVLLVLQGAWHLEMFASLFQELPDIGWVVFIEAPQNTLTELSKTLPENVQVIGSIVDLMLRIDTFSICLTTLAVAHRAHMRGIQIFFACSQLGISVLELQHGLFQLGINYYDFSATPGDGFRNSSLGQAGLNFRDGLLSWGGDDGIGFPQYHQLAEAEDGNYVLILSNLHWSIFSQSEQHLFYDGIQTLVRNNPDQNFIWKPHQAEIQPRLEHLHSHLVKGSIPNLEVLTPNKMGKRTTSELIRCCTCAISSPSSVLLELEMHAKACIVYAPASTQGLMSIVKKADTYVLIDDLISQCSMMLAKPASYRLETGHLRPFDPVKLRRKLKASWNAESIGKKAVAEVIVPMIGTFQTGAALNKVQNMTRISGGK